MRPFIDGVHNQELHLKWSNKSVVFVKIDEHEHKLASVSDRNAGICRSTDQKWFKSR